MAYTRKTIKQLENENRELLGMLSAALWVLEHPEVNAIKFCGNPFYLAKSIRERVKIEETQGVTK